MCEIEREISELGVRWSEERYSELLKYILSLNTERSVNQFKMAEMIFKYKQNKITKSDVLRYIKEH